MNEILPNIDYSSFNRNLFWYFCASALVAILKNEIIIFFLEVEIARIARFSAHFTSFMGLTFGLIILIICIFMTYLMILLIITKKIDFSILLESFILFVKVLMVGEAVRLFLVFFILYPELEFVDFSSESNALDILLIQFSEYNKFLNLIFPLVGCLMSAYYYYKQSIDLLGTATSWVIFAIIYIITANFL